MTTEQIKIIITFCPICKSKNVSYCNKDLERLVPKIGKVIVPSVKVTECKDCGEIMLDKDALEYIHRYITTVKTNVE